MSSGRAVGAAALLAAAVAALSWASTFSLVPLLPLVVVPLVVMALVDQLTADRPAIRAAAGLAVGVGVALAVLVVVDGASLADVVAGVTGGWRHTLDSTLPARSDVSLVAFLPALAVVAGALGSEWARRGAGPAAVLTPSFVLLVLGQIFHAASGWAAVGTALAYGVAVCGVLVAGRQRAPGRGSSWRRLAELGPGLAVLVVIGGLTAWGASAAALPGLHTYSVQDSHTPDTRTLSTADPLEQIADHLLSGNTVAFTVHTDQPVDRWPLAVLDRFDGVNWSSGGTFLSLGTQLPAARLAVPVTPATAEISDVHVEGPWLPTQEHLRSAVGIRPLVDPATGVLLRDDGDPGRYQLRWDAVQVDAAGLTSSAIDSAPVGAVALDAVPAGISSLARRAVGTGVGPSVQAALLLEKWMRQNYQVATATDLPTGHSYAQLLNFLTTSKRGTSEQFATSYAVLARSLGIPTRVVVGFRGTGSGTVHDGDVLAWPEIAVSGIGWVPLDPTGGARSSGGGGSDLSAATQAARQELPTPAQLAAQDVGTPVPVAVAGPASALSWWAGGVPGALVVVLVAAVPVTKLVRRMRRRRSPPRRAVIGAWLELRDALRDHGLAVPVGATVRELLDSVRVAAPAEPADLCELAMCVDAALWTGYDTDPALVRRAWAASDRIRRALRQMPMRRRLRAAFAVRTLRRDRRQPEWQPAPRSG
jgi:hypothetical protein